MPISKINYYFFDVFLNEKHIALESQSTAQDSHSQTISNTITKCFGEIPTLKDYLQPPSKNPILIGPILRTQHCTSIGL